MPSLRKNPFFEASSKYQKEQRADRSSRRSRPAPKSPSTAARIRPNGRSASPGRSRRRRGFDEEMGVDSGVGDLRQLLERRKRRRRSPEKRGQRQRRWSPIPRWRRPQRSPSDSKRRGEKEREREQQQRRHGKQQHQRRHSHHRKELQQEKRHQEEELQKLQKQEEREHSEVVDLAVRAIKGSGHIEDTKELNRLLHATPDVELSREQWTVWKRKRDLQLRTELKVLSARREARREERLRCEAEVGRIFLLGQAALASSAEVNKTNRIPGLSWEQRKYQSLQAAQMAGGGFCSSKRKTAVEVKREAFGDFVKVEAADSG